MTTDLGEVGKLGVGPCSWYGHEADEMERLTGTKAFLDRRRAPQEAFFFWTAAARLRKAESSDIGIRRLDA